MFDIGVNLTSSQFSRDHDEVVARARAAGGSRHAADRHKFAGEPAGPENGEPLFRLLVHGRGSSP